VRGWRPRSSDGAQRNRDNPSMLISSGDSGGIDS
jgi:hypothetical protein